MKAFSLAALASTMLAPLAAHADADSRLKAMLDRPSATQTAKASAGEIVCTSYPDLMVRETGTDTPDPDPATLTPIKPGAAKPACKAPPGAGGIKLKTEGFAFVGRKGGFLIWDASDPNGAEPFMVMNTSGKVLFTAATSPDPALRRTATLQGGVLHLAYTRGYNADCSLVKDARGCWTKVVAAGVVPASTPPPASCRAAYQGVGADDPSVIVFTTEVTVGATGKSAVLSRGPLSCLPMP